MSRAQPRNPPLPPTSSGIAYGSGIAPSPRVSGSADARLPDPRLLGNLPQISDSSGYLNISGALHGIDRALADVRTLSNAYSRIDERLEERIHTISQSLKDLEPTKTARPLRTVDEAQERAERTAEQTRADVIRARAAHFVVSPSRVLELLSDD